MSPSDAEPTTKAEQDAVMRQSQDAPPDAEPTTKAERRRWGLGDGILRARIRILVTELENLEAERDRLQGALYIHGHTPGTCESCDD